MASTAHEHFVDANKMYAVQEQFRCATKMVAMCKICTLHARMSAMVRNAGQLPQPFWLGSDCGGGSCGAARCAART